MAQIAYHTHFSEIIIGKNCVFFFFIIVAYSRLNISIDGHEMY